MLRSRLATPFLALVLFSAAGCAGSYCTDPEHESDAMCQLNLGGTVAAFTVSPARIAFNKNASTLITISAYSKLTKQPATLTQSGGIAKPIQLGWVGAEGTLSVTILASNLAAQGFVPGPADVEIAGQKRPIRIFVAPKFDSSTFSAARSVAADQGAGNLAAPSWVGIQTDGSKKILTLNEYAIATIAKQAIGEYYYDPSNKVITKFSPLLFSAYNSTPQMDMLHHSIALGTSGLVIPEFGNASISLLTQCSLDGICSSAAVPYGNIYSLTTSLAGQIYAGIFNGKVLAFSDANLASSIPIANFPSSTVLPALVTVFDENADAHPDLAVFYPDGNVSIALSDSAGKNLSYEPKAGDALKNTAGLANAAPDAVAAGDIDQDGLDDLVIAKGGSLFVLSNEGGGTFSAGPALAIPVRGATGSVLLTPVSAIVIGDVSADATRLKDLVLVSKTNRLLAVMENTATVQ